MKLRLECFCCLMVICFNFLSCTDADIMPEPSALKENNTLDAKSASPLAVEPTPGFSNYKYFLYFKSRTENKIVAGWSPEGIHWVSERVTLPENTDYFKSVYLSGKIYLVYKLATGPYFYLRSSVDGVTWSSARVTQLPTTYGKPEVAIINNQLHFLFVRTVNTSAFLTIYKYVPESPFNAWPLVSNSSSAIVSDARNVGMPAYAEINGVHHIFFQYNFASPNWYTPLRVMTSSDLLNWTWKTNFVLESQNVANSSLDATTFKGKIYISYRAGFDRVKVLIYTGTSPISGTFHEVGTATAESQVSITHDADKVIVSYRGQSVDYNFISYSYTGSTWFEKRSIGSTNSTTLRDIVSVGYN